MNTDITRTFATEGIGNTGTGGFTIEATKGGWLVSDGTASVTITDPAEALTTYAEYMETFVDDVDDEANAERPGWRATKAEWVAEIAAAKAAALEIAASSPLTASTLIHLPDDIRGGRNPRTITVEQIWRVGTLSAISL